ncbi:MAG: GNAT family N-acetyltransferase [Euryarchaeota archaeon]|nr:GNAT family N-acetyltransferase [Euryarchaeota archaeon]MDE2046283.1 GNAT family N-acetyltransferase [Thermoplasmata archaeon]
MGPGSRVREVRPSDREDLIRGYLDLYREREVDPFVGIVLGERAPSVEAENSWFDGLMEGLRVGKKVACVADVGGHAVGLCDVTRRGYAGVGDIAHVGDLGILVHRGHRDQGLGEALLRRVIEECQGRFELLVLSVFANNARAKHLYEKVGFRHYGTLPRGIKRNGGYVDSEEMYLELPPRTAVPRKKSA